VEFQLLLRLLKGRKEAPSGGEKEAAIYKYSAAAAPSRDSNKFVHRLRNWKNVNWKFWGKHGVQSIEKCNNNKNVTLNRLLLLVLVTTTIETCDVTTETLRLREEYKYDDVDIRSDEKLRFD